MHFRHYVILLIIVALIGCGKTPKKIIPCVTSVDHIDFTGVDELRAFIKETVPMGSSPKCAETVMIGDAMNRYSIHAGLAEGTVNHAYRERPSHAKERLWYWITLTYGDRLIWFSYKNGKLIEWEAH